MAISTQKKVVDLDSNPIVINTATQTFDLKQIRNRRFMYSTKHRTLVLGDAAGIKKMGSHAEEFHQLQPPGKFDDYIRGWIGRNSTDYKKGIVHFAPQIYAGNLDEGLAFLFFAANISGTGRKTKVRGFQNVPECDLAEIIPSLFK